MFRASTAAIKTAAARLWPVVQDWILLYRGFAIRNSFLVLAGASISRSCRMQFGDAADWKSALRKIVALAAFLALAQTAPAIVPWSLFINTNNVKVVTNAAYGAVGDGVFTNTTAIQNAINDATAGGTTNSLIGGTVEIPPGVYLCGPLTFKKNVN